MATFAVELSKGKPCSLLSHHSKYTDTMKPFVTSLMKSLVLALSMSTSILAQRATPPPGYSYDHPTAPDGQEWQSPTRYALNKERPHAYFFSFAPHDCAERVLPEHSSYYHSLDGKWRFHWVRTPDEREKNFYSKAFDDSRWEEVTVPMNWNVYGLQPDGSKRYGTPIYVNQPVIFYHEVRPGDWRGGVMRTPPKEWTTYRDRNEVGAYRRSFSLPEKWDGKRVYLNFDGVDSFFYLWVNGRYVGFSKNSRSLASFDITPYLEQGKENTLAVEVYRNSDGSFLESQDMFRLPGIFRSVYLTAKPEIQLRDLQVIPQLDLKRGQGVLELTAEVERSGKKRSVDEQVRYHLYSLPLYSDEPAERLPVEAQSRVDAEGIARTSLTLDAPKLWSAEAPYRYVLVAELYDRTGKRLLDRASIYTGFRQVEIRETPAHEDEFGRAGRYFYVNGRPIKLKGTNRHETSPERGHAITCEQMQQEVFLMRRANINHVRNSHYPTSPYWYYLCDKYGIYLEDEANIESHQYYYGKASLSHVPEFEAQHVSRMLEMVSAHINHPSIVIWSLGNEAGPGDNFVKSYRAAKALDSSRPIQYERNNDIVDMGSNQYPSIAWVQGAAEGNYDIKYPFHISEYAHSMGNAVGGLDDYWRAIESSNFICGGAIWDWVDQALYHHTPDGKRFLAYGGDFGDTPNDGMFVMNGLMFADLSPKPQYYEVKKVYQQIGFTAKDLRAGKITLFNKHYFTDLSAYALHWSLVKDGVVVEEGTMDLPMIAPRHSADVLLPIASEVLDPSSEYFVKVGCVQKKALPWAEEGYTVAEEQFALQTELKKPALQRDASLPRLKTSQTKGKEWIAEGGDFSIRFDLTTGMPSSYVLSGDTLLSPAMAPRLTGFRAPCDNDNWIRASWISNGLHNLRPHVLSQRITPQRDGSVELFFAVRWQAPNEAMLTMTKASGNYKIMEHTDKPLGRDDFSIMAQQVWYVSPSGDVTLRSSLSSSKPALPLGRLGYEFVLPQRFDRYTYYGRGPVNNYADRKSGQFVGKYQSRVADQFIHFPKPQTMANREDVRWVSLRDAAGKGLLFVTDSVMTSSALPWSALDLMLAPHPHELPPAGDTHLVLSASTTGLGGNSCGQGPPLAAYQTLGKPQVFSLLLRPLRSEGDETEHAKVSFSGSIAPAMMRSPQGLVSVMAPASANIRYRINDGKVMTYTAPFDLAGGGKVTVWDVRTPSIIAEDHFPKLIYSPATIHYCSSEEEGYESQYLIDDNPESFWHSVWTLTVPKHPHWVELDIQREQAIKGIIYQNRQDESWIGAVKDFSISVSSDGKTWKEVHRGTLAKDRRPQEIHLAQVQRARYLRFTALSAQDGLDYTSISELRILTN